MANTGRSQHPRSRVKTAPADGRFGSLADISAEQLLTARLLSSVAAPSVVGSSSGGRSDKPALWIPVDMLERPKPANLFSHKFHFWAVGVRRAGHMSVLDYFARIRRYRERASEFELLAETEELADVRLRYRIIARHYRELAEREEQADKARMADRIARIRMRRQQTAAQLTLPARTIPEFFLIAAE